MAKAGVGSKAQWMGLLRPLTSLLDKGLIVLGIIAFGVQSRTQYNQPEMSVASSPLKTTDI